MKLFKRPIAISLAPNMERDDGLLAFKTLFLFWKWKGGKNIKSLENWFAVRFKKYSVYSFNSGRSAMYTILKSFGIGIGDEVLVQAFTCIAAIAPILWLGAKPVFVDIDKNFNIDYKKLEQKINSKTKAVIVQHTFGFPANIEKIKKIARRHKLFFLEDCAHVLGAKYKKSYLGSFADAAFFSFGRDKILSSVFGGVALIKSSLMKKNRKMQKIYRSLSFPDNFWIFQQLFHLVSFTIILPFYQTLNIGKLLLVIFQKMKLLSFPILQEEYSGKKPAIFPKKYPNALAVLLLNQMRKLSAFSAKRQLIVQIYDEKFDRFGAFYDKNKLLLRYPFLSDRAEEICRVGKKRGFLLGRWYANIVDPKGVSLNNVGYVSGSCPAAENISKRIINLPTYPTLKKNEAEMIADFVKEYENRSSGNK